MILPDYNGGSIVNLMSSVIRSRGGRSAFAPLLELPPSELAKSKNVVLLVLDGLGYEFLQKRGPKSFLYQNTVRDITSVYPSATAAAITTYNTGVAPAQHGMTGWYMHFRELGVVATSLIFRPRVGGQCFGIESAREIFKEPCVYERVKTKAYRVFPQDIAGSDFSMAHSHNETILGYGGEKYNAVADFKMMLAGIAHAVSLNNRSKYIYAYWPHFDSASHAFGPGGRQTIKHFWMMDKWIARFFKALQGSGTTFIISADHGQIHTPKDKRIELCDHPKLAECLSLPMCGEARNPYCYVRPGKERQFEEYITSTFNGMCSWKKSSQAIAQGWFGPGKQHPELERRVGDYILLMEDGYIFKDRLIGEKKKGHYLGNHGGLSADEVKVPLIVLQG